MLDAQVLPTCTNCCAQGCRSGQTAGETPLHAYRLLRPTSPPETHHGAHVAGVALSSAQRQHVRNPSYMWLQSALWAAQKRPQNVALVASRCLHVARSGNRRPVSWRPATKKEPATSRDAPRTGVPRPGSPGSGRASARECDLRVPRTRRSA